MRNQGPSTPSFSMLAISSDSSATRRGRIELDEANTSGNRNKSMNPYQEPPISSGIENQRSVHPGAFPVRGTNPSIISSDYTLTPPPQSRGTSSYTVAARVVDRDEEDYEEELRQQEERIKQQERELEQFRRNQELQERLRQREELMAAQQRELEQLRQSRQGAAGFVVGKIISSDNDEEEQVRENTREEIKGPPSSSDEHASSPQWRSSSKRIIVIGVVIILVCVGVAVGVVFATRPKPTIESTMTPSAAPTSLSRTTADLLSSVSSDEGAALETPDTPQNKAFNWLVENTNIDTYLDEKKIQRYSLATLYYSTNGDSWTVNTGWLGNGDECGWSNNHLRCTNGSIMELTLSSNNLVGSVPAEIGLLSNSLGKCPCLLSSQ